MASTPPSERDRDRRSLKDLAKLAGSPSLTPAPPSSKGTALSSRPPPPLYGTTPADPGDSGIVDLKKITEADPGALGRPMPPVSVPAGAETRPTPALAPPPLSSVPPGPQAPFPAIRPHAPVLSVDHNPFARKKKRGLAWAAGIGAALAATAVAVLVHRAQPGHLIAESPPAPPPPAAAAAPPSEPMATAPPATPPTAMAKADTPASGAVEPPSAASGALAQKALAAGAAAPRKSLTVAGKSAAPPVGPPAAAPPNPALVAKLPSSAPSPQGGGGGSLNDALRAAAGPIDAPPPAAGPSAPAAPLDNGGGNVPQKPSLGAVASSVGTAKEQARACLSPDSPVSHATLTFVSSGAVTDVSVTGFAAGKPAEGCIKAALKKAKVPPFAQPSYSTGVTIRP